MHCSLLRYLSTLAMMLLLATRTSAAPGDAAAKQKIDEAINQHYLATNFDQAEQVLVTAAQTCAKRCSPAVLGRIWMYVGLVRINGKQDKAGAVQAFKRALSIDPKVELDEALVTPPASAAFSEAGGKSKSEPAAAEGEGAEATEGARCTPEPREVSVGQPIPVACTSAKGAKAGTLYYAVPGSSSWVEVPMDERGGSLRATVPCRGVAREGTLRVYVELRDSQGKVAESVGTRTTPIEYTLVKRSVAGPPAFPGESPPPLCKPEQLGQPAPVRGTKELGEGCIAHEDCASGLCVQGSCDRCTRDQDCPSGECREGICALGEEEGWGEAGEGKKNLVGVHLGLDLGYVSGSDVCTRRSQEQNGYACFYSGYVNQYIYSPVPGYGDQIKSGLHYGTTRILLSYDRLLTSTVSGGLRVGYALGGSPKTLTGQTFLPVHLEVRAAVWLLNRPLVGPGVHPYLHLGGGMGAVHVKKKVEVWDCAGGYPPRDPPSPDYDACARGDPTVVSQMLTGEKDIARRLELDAYKRMGNFFLAGGGGAVFGLSSTMGLKLNLNLMMLLPNRGVVVEPSLGPVLGF